MFATPAFAHAAGSAAQGASPFGDPSMFIMLAGMLVLGYFFIFRPQSQRAKQHKAMLSQMKRNDTVVLSSGLIGKITRVEETEVMVEIATGVNVRVVKSMISEVRAKGDPAPANDSKAA